MGMRARPGNSIRLPAFEGPFDTHRLAADGCDVLVASYPAGTVIPALGGCSSTTTTYSGHWS